MIAEEEGGSPLPIATRAEYLQLRPPVKKHCAVFTSPPYPADEWQERRKTGAFGLAEAAGTSAVPDGEDEQRDIHAGRAVSARVELRAPELLPIDAAPPGAPMRRLILREMDLGRLNRQNGYPMRLSDRGSLVLTSLAGGEKHAYMLLKDVEAFSGVKLGPGTLYGALGRLEKAGLIESLAEEQGRRPYRITPQGRQFLADHLAESARLASLGLRRIALGQE